MQAYNRDVIIMKNSESLKYYNEIADLESFGVELPKLMQPLNLDAFRFAFQTNHNNNHRPVYKIDPQRAIQSIKNKKVTTSGFALSCYNSEINAKSTFMSLCRNFKLFPKTAGDSLYHGRLLEVDGLVTDIENNGHFDFYEYSNFDRTKDLILKRSYIETIKGFRNTVRYKPNDKDFRSYII